MPLNWPNLTKLEALFWTKVSSNFIADFNRNWTSTLQPIKNFNSEFARYPLNSQFLPQEWNHPDFYLGRMALFPSTHQLFTKRTEAHTTFFSSQQAFSWWIDRHPLHHLDPAFWRRLDGFENGMDFSLAHRRTFGSEGLAHGFKRSWHRHKSFISGAPLDQSQASFSKLHPNLNHWCS